MTVVIDGVLMILLALVLLPVTVLLVEVLCALMPRRPAPLPNITRPCLAVLVPAHDESAGIMETLNSVLPQLVEGDRLIVVADNCSDDTAQVAACGGAEVVERDDATRRGKGYALDFGVRYLARNLLRKTPEVVVVIDADCQVTAGAIDRIARLSASTGRPVQAMYMMKAPEPAGVMAPIAEFAWVVKNQVRPLGAHNLGLPCQLMGTGMALPWNTLQSVHLASGHIVEDLQLGLDFARAGTPALYCPEAVVLSHFAVNEAGATTQRTRWEHGHLGMIVEVAPRLFLDGLKNMGSGLLVLALDLCVPPLALLTLVIIALLSLSVSNALITTSLPPLLLSGVVVFMFVLAVGLSWWRFGRETVSPGGLLQVLEYVLRKVPLYLKFLVRRQKKWERSKRDAD